MAIALAVLSALAAPAVTAADDVRIGEDVVVLTVEQATRDGERGVHVRVWSAEAPVNEDAFTYCRPGLYNARCGAVTDGDAASPRPSVMWQTQGANPSYCVQARASADPKDEAWALACTPGHWYPLPWGECVTFRLEAARIVETGTTRCLVP